MKKVKLGISVIVLVLLAILGLGSLSQQAPNFSYVYSDSMEPTINTGDGFFVIPSNNYQINDIIVFRSTFLDAELITHRIIAITSDGFITQGDNSPNIDQNVGEPVVIPDRIIGKVLTVFNNPVVIPQVGNYLLMIQSRMGSFTSMIAILLFVVASLFLIRDLFTGKYKRKSKIRLRMHHVYQALALTTTAVLIVTLLVGSSYVQIRYLISQNPGNIGLQTRPNQIGETDYLISNNSILPVYSFISAIEPIISEVKVVSIGSLSVQTIQVKVNPQTKLGWYTGYIQVMNLPALLPRFLVERLYLVHPWMAIFSIILATYGWLLLLIKIFELTFSLSGRVPIKGLKDKFTKRKMRLWFNQVFGKRRLKFK